ncbi:MAG: ATP-binding protein [Methanobrevibacter sp.]|nr:ATP-binding protein [Methanobrevibacter sp.]
MSIIPWGLNSELTDDQFFNRERDISFLSTILDTTKDEIPPSILLTGIRGVGKTALLKKLKRDFESDYLVIYLDLSSSNNYQEDKLSRKAFMQLFYKRIIESCREYGLKTIDKEIESWIKTHNFTLRKILDFEGIPIPVPGFEDDYAKLADFVMNLPGKIYDEYSDEMYGILIFIDEFQLLSDLDNETSSFLWYLRSFIQREKNVSYTFTGSMSIQDKLIGEINGKNGAFGGRMLTYQLEPFDYETTKRYLLEKANHLEFTEDGMEMFYECTKGIPFYINTFLRFLINEGSLDKEMVEREFYNVLPFLAIHLINDWKNLTKQEQKIITCLIDEPLRRIDIAKKLNVTSGGIGASLNNLFNRGLIKYEDSRYDIFDHILKAWLKMEFEKRGVYPYRDF